MNWKKWDEDTWVNMSNGHMLNIQSDKQDFGVLYFSLGERRLGNQDFTKTFPTLTEAVAFIEELIK